MQAIKNPTPLTSIGNHVQQSIGQPSSPKNQLRTPTVQAPSSITSADQSLPSLMPINSHPHSVQQEPKTPLPTALPYSIPIADIIFQEHNQERMLKDTTHKTTQPVQEERIYNTILPNNVSSYRNNLSLCSDCVLTSNIEVAVREGRPFEFYPKKNRLPVDTQRMTI